MDGIRDELGQKIRKEKLIARVWAKVRLIRSSESIKLLKNEATEEMQFTIRYRKGIDKNHENSIQGSNVWN